MSVPVHTKYMFAAVNSGDVERVRQLINSNQVYGVTYLYHHVRFGLMLQLLLLRSRHAGGVGENWGGKDGDGREEGWAL